MSPIPLRDSQYFNLDESNLNSIVDHLKSGRKSGMKGIRQVGEDQERRARSSIKQKLLSELSMNVPNDLALLDDNPEVIKKRKQIRARISELATRNKGGVYSNDNSFEEPLEPISKKNMKFDLNHYYDVPQSKNVEPDQAYPEMVYINSPVEDVNNIGGNDSIQIKRFTAINNEAESDSRRSLKMKESWEAQKMNSYIADEKPVAIQFEEPKPDIQTKVNKNAKAKKNTDKNKQNNKPTKTISSRAIVEEQIDKKSFEQRVDLPATGRGIVEEPYDDIGACYDYGNDYAPVSPLKLENESVNKFKKGKKQNPDKILEDPIIKAGTIQENRSKERMKTIQEKRTLKKPATIFADVTNQQRTTKNPPKPRAKRQAKKETDGNLTRAKFERSCL